MRPTRTVIGLVAAADGVVIGNAPAIFIAEAHADANSYLAYLADHHVNTALNSQSRNLQAGFFACDALHAGQTPDQVANSQPFNFVDVRGVIDAAQHELCPDTLH